MRYILLVKQAADINTNRIMICVQTTYRLPRSAIPKNNPISVVVPVKWVVRNKFAEYMLDTPFLWDEEIEDAEVVGFL